MGLCSCCCRCLEILCAILLPPLGVCLRHGCCTVRSLPLSLLRRGWILMEFWISVLLTLLGYLPGILYAVYVIVSVDPDRDRRSRGVDPDEYIYVA
uniref:Hydrophobic protein OSR8 n=1 Tax=Leersia perrieri TaxID=77586 RepID=A0A0D9WMN9_9ORYZ